MADDRLAGQAPPATPRSRSSAPPHRSCATRRRSRRRSARETALTPPIVRAIADVLQTDAASPGLRQGLESLRASRFVDLVRGDTVNANEQGARELLRAIGLMALGDTVNAVSAPLRQAQQLNAPPAAVHFVDGAARAIEGRERDALTAWTAAMKAGFDAAALTPLLVDSHLRLGEAPQALELATRTAAARPGEPVLRRGLAAAQMASKQEADAIAGLEALVTEQPADQDARWMLMHALFAGHVSGQGAGATPQGKQQLRDLAQEYGCRQRSPRRTRDGVGRGNPLTTSTSSVEGRRARRLQRVGAPRCDGDSGAIYFDLELADALASHRDCVE